MIQKNQKNQRKKRNNMNVDAKLVKDLRERTGAGMMDCKKALVESKGDLDSAIEFLRKAGVTKAEKKSVRDANEGLIISYIHHGSKLGVLLDIGCETDFVPKTKGFKELANNIAMQIAATNPIAISKNDLSSDLIDKERDIYTEQAKSTGKPNNIVKKIVDGKIEKFIEENCLINQSFIKDPDVKIGQLIQEAIAKLGENITINRFVRFALGEKN